MPTKEAIVRTCVFRPYRLGCGPYFRLRVWDTYRRDGYGKCILGYSLFRCEPETLLELFAGEDFHNSPMHAIDSDATIAGLMGFLTLRPGDTDQEYFDNYTPEQLDYCSQHAEALACEVMNRFPE